MTGSKINQTALIPAQKKDRLTIRQISNNMGFNDLSTLARQFRLLPGINPWK
ncbi:MAG: hypothetical protein JSV88_11010 [Candidatus Aminicenantes bacterium]|nr:MAG: hypothetical protein JSV88_11010 [Candidatus Aminicenantes bacterium]